MRTFKNSSLLLTPPSCEQGHVQGTVDKEDVIGFREAAKPKQALMLVERVPLEF